MTRIILEETPSLTQSIEIEAADGEVTIYAITDEDGEPVRRAVVGFPVEVVGRVIEGLAACSTEDER